jgi:hypothetical protein
MPSPNGDPAVNRAKMVNRVVNPAKAVAAGSKADLADLGVAETSS